MAFNQEKTAQYLPSVAAHSSIVPAPMQVSRYLPSIAAHSTLGPALMHVGRYLPSIVAHSSLILTSLSAAGSTDPTTEASALLPSASPSLSPSPSTSPGSPTAEDLIAALENPEDLSDDELYKAAENAQAALAKWQFEWNQLDRNMEFTAPIYDQDYVPQGRREKVLGLKKEIELLARERDQAYKRLTQPVMVPESTRAPNQRAVRARDRAAAARSTSPGPSRATAPKTSTRPSRAAARNTSPGPAGAAATQLTRAASVPLKSIKNPLAIDMNVPDPTEVHGKRVRKPRKIFEGGDGLNGPFGPVQVKKQRAREASSDNNANGEKTIEEGTNPMPPAKKRSVRAKSVTQDVAGPTTSAPSPPPPAQKSKKRAREASDDGNGEGNNPMPSPKKRSLRAKPVKKDVAGPATSAPSPPPPAPKSKKRAREASPAATDNDTATIPPPKKRSARSKSVTKNGSAPPIPAPTPAPYAPKSKKRARDTPAAAITDDDDDNSDTNATTAGPPPPKKRATRSKSVKTDASLPPPSATSSGPPEAPAPRAKTPTGIDPTRSAAMKAAWAKRHAEGRSGRHGGKPLEKTVARKAAGK